MSNIRIYEVPKSGIIESGLICSFTTNPSYVGLKKEPLQAAPGERERFRLFGRIEEDVYNHGGHATKDLKDCYLMAVLYKKGDYDLIVAQTD